MKKLQATQKALHHKLGIGNEEELEQQGTVFLHFFLGVKGLKSVPCRDNLKFQDNLIPQLIKEACETLKWDPKLCGANSYMSFFLYFQSSLRLQMAIFRI